MVCPQMFRRLTGRLTRVRTQSNVSSLGTSANFKREKRLKALLSGPAPLWISDPIPSAGWAPLSSEMAVSPAVSTFSQAVRTRQSHTTPSSSKTTNSPRKSIFARPTPNLGRSDSVVSFASADAYQKPHASLDFPRTADLHVSPPIPRRGSSDTCSPSIYAMFTGNRPTTDYHKHSAKTSDSSVASTTIDTFETLHSNSSPPSSSATRSGSSLDNWI